MFNLKCSFREFIFKLKTQDCYQLLNWLTSCLIRGDVKLNSTSGPKMSRSGPGEEKNDCERNPAVPNCSGLSLSSTWQWWQEGSKGSTENIHDTLWPWEQDNVTQAARLLQLRSGWRWRSRVSSLSPDCNLFRHSGVFQQTDCKYVFWRFFFSALSFVVIVCRVQSHLGF